MLNTKPLSIQDIPLSSNPYILLSAAVTHDACGFIQIPALYTDQNKDKINKRH